MKITFDSEQDGMPPINLLAFERWLSEQTKGMTPTDKSKHFIVIDAFLGCQDCVCSRVQIGLEADGFIPSFPKTRDGP